VGLDDLADELVAAIPDGGYLRRYVEYGWRSTMSPPEFHLACGLTQMAVLMGNKVLIRGPGAKLYPAHLWVAMVGPAGAARKSSGISLATSMLDTSMGDSLAFAVDTTREALWTALQERPYGYMVWSEFAGFLARAKTEYMGGIKEDLCEWWDSPPMARRRLQKAEYLVRQPAMSVMAGAVPERLVDLIQEADLHGGFFSRFLFITQVTPVPYRGLEWDPGRRAELSEELAMLARHPELAAPHARVEVWLGDAERKVWEAYDQALWEMPESKDPLTSGFMSRCGVQALKLSFCYALARGSLQPEEQDVVNAIAFTEFCRKHAMTLVEEADANGTRVGQTIRRVRDNIRSLAARTPEGWVKQSDLLRRSHLKARDLEEYLETMVDAGSLETREVGTAGAPRREVRLL